VDVPRHATRDRRRLLLLTDRVSGAKLGGVVRTIEDVRAACDSHRWGDAWRLLAGVDADTLEVDDLDRLALAAYLTGHDEEGIAHWTAAHQRCVGNGELHRAAHFGAKIAQGLGFAGDIGRCRGWVDRTARLLEEAGIDCVEQGYLEHGLGMLRLFEVGDLAGAHAHFVHARKIGARFVHRELTTLARIAEGRMLVYLGDIPEGMALLDEAMVSIEAGELSPMATGDAYCTVIDACGELFDLARCRAWSEAFARWCDTQQELVLYRGHCFLHRAEVLGLLGAWADALDAARHACDRLAAPLNPAVLGAACAIEGDLLRLVGDLGGAESSYERAAEFGHDPQPGLALLRSAQGRLDAADAMIRRALGETEGPIPRARLLGPYVELVLRTGDIPAARAAANELRGVADEIKTPLLRALASRATGAVLFAEGDPEAALVELRRAFNELNGLGVRHDAARTRLLIAEACHALGDHDTASMESRAARSALVSLARSSTPLEQSPASAPGGLTARELEVLRLVAQGKSNRVIAQELVVSEKTVASHISHVFTKLGVTSRSAATAYAYDHHLV
jgi:DNA-binding CsgD family transcriptional regulator/tetratricopeptide (TPR) repeat protein